MLLCTGFCTSTGEEEENNSSGSTSSNYGSSPTHAHTIIPAITQNPRFTFSFRSRGNARLNSSSLLSSPFYGSRLPRSTTLYSAP